MTTAKTTIEAPVQVVWDALVDVRTYPRWLIGALAIRRVDEGWPRPGTAFHHTVGLAGPFSIRDRTRCDECTPPNRLVLDVRALPVAHGKVTFELEPTERGTHVTLEEHPVGIFRILRPVIALTTIVRNWYSLERLGHLVEAQGAQEDDAQS